MCYNNYYGIYKVSRNASWQFLIDNHVSELPLKLGSICHNLGYKILEDNKIHYLQQNQRGITFYNDNSWNIIINNNLTSQSQRYTIAHELGHIFLGHPLLDCKYGRTFNINNTFEYQAERFAIDILAPACVLWALDLHTPLEISQLCNISIASATKRAERMEELYHRNMFLSHPLERQIYNQFKKFIDDNKR